jgi:hypothetical protein
MKLRYLSSLALFTLCASTVSAQFTLSGEFRPRTEVRHGFKTLSDSAQKSAFFTDQRTRLTATYKTEGFQTKLVLQDVRVWGSQPQLVANDGALTTVHEAWGEAFINDKIGMRFGRQELVYDDHRIFGNVGWAQQARSHDALLFRIKFDTTFQMHIGGAYNQDGAGLVGTSAGNGSYKAMQFLWLKKQFNKELSSSFLFLNNGKQVNYTNGLGGDEYHDNYSQTIGTHTAYKGSKFGVTFNGYYQMGKTNQRPARDIGAYLVGLDLSYKISANMKAILGFEMQSGNDQTDTTASYAETEHAFSPFYGTNHKFNGFMDYFYVGNHNGSVGLQDFYLKLKYKKAKKSVGVDVHLFMAAGEVTDQIELATNGNYKAMAAQLGTEIDLYCGFPVSKGVMFKAGYSHMIGTETMATLKGVTNYKGELNDETNNWAYFMLIVKPTFLKK